MNGQTFPKLGFVKCFIEDKGETEKMASTLSYSESGRTFKGIPNAKYRQNAFFLRFRQEMTAWAMDFLQISVDSIVSRL